MTLAGNRRSLAWILLVLGLVVLACGLALGFSGVSDDGVVCGSAFRPNSHVAAMDSSQADGTYSVLVNAEANGPADVCGDAIGNRKLIASGGTLAGGAIAVAGAVLLFRGQSRRGMRGGGARDLDNGLA